MNKQLALFSGNVDYGKAITNYIDLKNRFLGNKYTMPDMENLYKELNGINKHIEIIGNQVKIQFDFNYDNIMATAIYYNSRIRLADIYDIYTDNNEFYDCIKIGDTGITAVR